MVTENVQKIIKERQSTHGDYATMALTAESLKELIRKRTSANVSKTQKYTLDMICVKIARIINGNPDTKDHWDDIAGYSTLASGEIEDDR
jgi:hypothetical protein